MTVRTGDARYEVPFRADFAMVDAPAVPSLWNTVYGWMLLLPMLFYSANGALEARTGPEALQIAAVQTNSSFNRFVQLCLGILICWFAVRNLAAVVNAARRNLAICAIPVLALCSVVWSDVHRQTLVNGIYLALLTTLALIISTRFVPQRRLELLVMTGAAALALSLVMVIFFPAQGVDPYQDGAWKGIFVQKNSAAAAAVVFGISAAYFEARGIAAAGVKWFVIVASALFLVMARSITGWELALVAAVVGGWLSMVSRFRRQEMTTLWGGFAVLVAAAGLVVFGYEQFILQLIGKDPTLNQRTMIWAITLKAATLHPLVGYGYTAFWRGMNGPSENSILSTGWRMAQAQSGYIDLLLNLGLVGMAGFIVILVSAGRGFLKSAFTANTRMPAYQRWSVVLIVTMLVYNIGESSIAQCYNMTWLVFLLAAMGLSEDPAAESVLPH